MDRSCALLPFRLDSGATPTSRIEEDTFTEDAAELKIFEALETFEGEKKQPMFGLTKFKFKLS